MELLYGDVRILQLVQNLGFDKGSRVGPKMAAAVNVLRSTITHFFTQALSSLPHTTLMLPITLQYSHIIIRYNENKLMFALLIADYQIGSYSRL